ncbi:MAG: hypothetical protein WC797_04355, partial [Candidatus Paceibacterota bacterium]
MISVLMISRDPLALESGSAVYERIKEYGALFSSLTVFVLVMGKSRSMVPLTVSENTKIYPISISLLNYLLVPFKIEKRLIEAGLSVDVVTTQNPFEAG